MSAADYRPQTFDGIKGDHIAEIESRVAGGDTPNFLFYGPPGTGKTTTAYAIAREIQGTTDELLEFDASDDRGIDAVRDSINPAANQTTLTGAPMVIFLDEMDSMTKEAQQALRKPMEQGSAVFVLACNDLHAVHNAVRSRCREYEFTLSERAIRERIAELADRDGVSLSDRQLDMVVGFAAGDMRAAIQRYIEVADGMADSPAVAQAAENFTD